MLNSVMRIGFGFSNVTFRPSRVFHSRIFSYPSVDTTNRVLEVARIFYQTFIIFRADNVFVRF